MKKAIMMDARDNVATAISEQLGLDNFAVWKYDTSLEALLGLLQAITGLPPHPSPEAEG